MSIKNDDKRPETGWGMPFAAFFNSQIEIENHARNGRSTKSFLAEGRWQVVLDKLKANDIVFIQFGHNDESPKKVDRYTTPEQYEANLKRYVSDTRAKKAIPVLFTPVTRRRFDENEMVRETHKGYSEIVRQLAADLDVHFIDMDTLSRRLLQGYGVEKSKSLFLQPDPGIHPNYPEGVKDNTHFNEYGAIQMALLVKQELKSMSLPLREYFIAD